MRIQHAVAVSVLIGLGTLNFFFLRVSIFFLASFAHVCSEGEARELSSELVVSSCFLRVVFYSRSFQLKASYTSSLT